MTTRRVIDIPEPPTPIARAACAMFGVHLRARKPTRRRQDTPAAHARDGAQRLHQRLDLGQVALVLGPSGSGKSTLLAHLAELAERQQQPVVRLTPVPGRTTPIDALPGSLAERLRALTSAGLADATLLARPARTLSDGERWRLALARAMVRAERAAGRARTPALLIADEFAATLDRLTARTVAALAARRVRTTQALRLALATNRDDLEPALQPEHRAECRLLTPCDIASRPTRAHDTEPPP